jgi:hypothetical protein
MDGLKPGRIVYYVLSAQDAAEINRRRTTGASIAERMKQELQQLYNGVQSTVFGWPAGAQAHIGTPVEAGEILPAMVLKVWGQESGCSNLKVMLDGTDTYWATSRNFAADKAPGTWHWMFEGQATRYQPDRVEKQGA